LAQSIESLTKSIEGLTQFKTAIIIYPSLKESQEKLFKNCNLFTHDGLLWQYNFFIYLIYLMG
jgi:hypothetical protein